jgi:hypothetical protein
MSLYLAAFSAINQTVYMTECKFAVVYILSLMSEGVTWRAGTFVNYIYIYIYFAVIFTCLAPEPAYNNSSSL